ncbi:MAG: hypothetical protein JWP00_2702 [Chloroflexi bacterium]|nr:hypothetical protein [Chloroflexota bacterium]
MNQNSQEQEQALLSTAGYSSSGPSKPSDFSVNQSTFSNAILLHLLRSPELIESEGQLDRMLRRTVEQLLELIPGDVATVALIEPERTWVKLTAAGPAAVGFEGYRLRLSEPKGLLESTLHEDRTISCDDCLNQDFPDVYSANQLGRGIAVPLRKQEKIVGILGIFRQVPQGVAFSPAEIALLELFARPVGPLLFNRRKLSDLETALKSRDEFLSIASHDLRNPLTALRGFTQLTARSIDKVPEGQPVPRTNIQANLQRIIKQTASLDKLIGKLLDVSRINTGRLEIQPELLELDEIVTEAVNHCRMAVATTENEDNVPPEKRHQILLEIAHKGLMGNFDRERIAQVITNLIDNAVKYSPEGGPIKINLHRAGDNFAELCVIDQGIGIPEEKQSVIFNRWSRVSTSRDGEISTSGLGLGLFICREIVRKHNGQISLHSEPDKGSTFFVLLPLVEE